ncbi:MAG: hypothetical protein JEY99_07750 [Spirochaetales bacterium]|nr:hypothetical protein [Spirochaetales bacterium]
MNPIYSMNVRELQEESGVPITEVETETDLYYAMALAMYSTIEKNNEAGRSTTMILPVGPVFQYRRFRTLLDFRPLNLSALHLFFMDEYISPGTIERIPVESPLSFRGFIKRELTNPMPEGMGFNPKQVYFPDPADPADYDKKIEALGGIDLCQAGVGIVGHLAFNEPISSSRISLDEFRRLPTRVVELTRETITINSNTALKGAFEEVPEKAITVGMKQILESRKLEIYMNRPWQASVLRKALMLSPSPEFPVTCAKTHPDLSYTITPLAAEVPDLALR